MLVIVKDMKGNLRKNDFTKEEIADKITAIGEVSFVENIKKEYDVFDGRRHSTMTFKVEDTVYMVECDKEWLVKFCHNWTEAMKSLTWAATDYLIREAASIIINIIFGEYSAPEYEQLKLKAILYELLINEDLTVDDGIVDALNKCIELELTEMNINHDFGFKIKTEMSEENLTIKIVNGENYIMFAY